MILCVNFRLVLKEEASDYLELETIKNLVKKYSQFINFPIYVWASKVISKEKSTPRTPPIPVVGSKVQHIEMRIATFRFPLPD